MPKAKDVDKTTLKNEPEEEISEERETLKKTTEEKTSEEKIRALEEERKRLHAQLGHQRERAQKLQEELEELKLQPPTPSEEDFTKSVPEWDELTPTEQALFKKDQARGKKILALEKEIFSLKNTLGWQEQFSQIVKAFPQIVEREEDFKQFIGDELPSEKLAKAFLYEEAKEIGAKEEKERTEKSGLEKGTGGEKTPLLPKRTLEDLARLRIEDPKKYFQLIRERKIKEIPEE